MLFFMFQGGKYPTRMPSPCCCRIHQTSKVLSLEVSCLCRILPYTDDDFHLNLEFNPQTMVFHPKSGFKKECPPQTKVLVLNLISQKSSLYRKILYLLGIFVKQIAPELSKNNRFGQNKNYSCLTLMSLSIAQAQVLLPRC